MVNELTATFEGHAQQTDGGVEYWLARDLQQLLGYTEWRNFTGVMSRARTACELKGGTPSPTILLTSTKWSTSAPVVSVKSKISCSRDTPAI